MSNREHTLILDAYRDLSTWPGKPSEREDPLWIRNVNVVELYADGQSLSEIKRLTGMRRDRIFELVRRCQMPDGKGSIFGFAACKPGFRVGYTRSAPVVRDIQLKQHGGCSGALDALLDEHPEVLKFIADNLFEGFRYNEAGEPVIAFWRLTDKVHRFLKKDLGFTEHDWPFNTASKGAESFRLLYWALGEANGLKWGRARGGKDAPARSRVGRAERSLLRAIRPYVYLQLDFQRVDSACTIVITYPDGSTIEVAVPRFYVGFLVEGLYHTIVGAYLTLEVEPSSDSGLETLSSAVIPLHHDANGDPWSLLVKERQALPNLQLPDLEGQCCAVVEVDNGWYALGLQLEDRILNELGAALLFGPVYSWWARPIVEMIQGEMARLGAQRLQSTTGHGIGDPKVIDNPMKRAFEAKVRIEDVAKVIANAIFEANNRPSEGSNHGRSSLESLKSALQHPESGYVAQKLPRPEFEHPRLLWTRLERTVKGNLTKQRRPYIQWGRGRYTSKTLEEAWDLIGKRCVIWIYNRDCRIMDVTVIETGADLGRLKVLPPYDRWPHSTRMRRKENEYARDRRFAHVGIDPLEGSQRDRLERIRARHKPGRAKVDREALDAVRHERAHSYAIDLGGTSEAAPDAKGMEPAPVPVPPLDPRFTSLPSVRKRTERP